LDLGAIGRALHRAPALTGVLLAPRRPLASLRGARQASGRRHGTDALRRPLIVPATARVLGSLRLAAPGADGLRRSLGSIEALTTDGMRRSSRGRALRTGAAVRLLRALERRLALLTPSAAELLRPSSL
jgi:hypothetical protein